MNDVIDDQEGTFADGRGAGDPDVHGYPGEAVPFNDLDKQIFEMVYNWGGYGVVVDHTAPAYQRLIEQLKRSTISEPF
ncbi:MAG: hypothetical protein QFB87_04720 [Patescibacteria group bacterium]|nr:hypothetical protein [Patescibacteria group bacterium]